MTYNQIRDRSLKLINQYSIAGDQIASTYNNQQDYLYRIPSLVNDAMLAISTSTRLLRSWVRADDLSYDTLADQRIYDMPDDFWQFESGGFRGISPEGKIRKYTDYQFIGGKQVMIPEAEANNLLLVEYCRRPERLPDEPDGKEELDVPEEAQAAIPYYVAAHLVMQDDSFQYASLYNEWETKLDRLGELTRTELPEVDDQYASFFEGSEAL